MIIDGLINLKYILKEIDNKMLQTLHTFILKPLQLSPEYSRGQMMSFVGRTRLYSGRFTCIQWPIMSILWQELDERACLLNNVINIMFYKVIKTNRSKENNIHLRSIYFPLVIAKLFYKL